MLEEPDFTFHLKESAQADLVAHAKPVLGDEKARVLQAIKAGLPDAGLRLDEETSPLVEVTFDGTPA